jgi:hypothetical protein
MAHDYEIVGSNPGTVYWMYTANATSYYNKETLKIKVVKWGTPKKIFKNSIFTNLCLLYMSLLFDYFFAAK